MRAMNIILLHPSELPDPKPSFSVRIQDHRAKHIHSVIKPNPGDHLRVGVLGGEMGLGKVQTCKPDLVELEVVLDTPPPAPLPVTLLLAMPRPKVFRRVLQSCTALGVKQIYLMNSYRVEKSYWQTPFLQPEQIEEQLLFGLEQGRDCVLPEVHLRKLFKPFVEDELPQLCRGKRCFTAHPTSNAIPCPSGVSEESVLAIGPEGGFIQYEIDKLCEAGFETMSAGERILKVETALPAIIGKLFL